MFDALRIDDRALPGASYLAANRVNSPSLAQTLAGLRFSASFPADIVQHLAAAATQCTYPQGSVLFREGSENHQLLIVSMGRVALEMHVPGRGDVRILTLAAGDLVAWSALLGSGRMTTSAVAVDDVQVLAIPAIDLFAISDANPDFGYRLMRQVGNALAERLVATRLQLLDLFASEPPSIPASRSVLGGSDAHQQH